MGFEINEGHSKNIGISATESRRRVKDLDVGGTRIDRAREFKYLKSAVNSVEQ